MPTLIQDIRHALRGFRDRPAFTVTAALMLALGIGANTAIFSIVDAVILKPASFPEPDRLVMLAVARPDRPFEPVFASASPAQSVYWRAQDDVLEDVAAYRTISLSLNDGDVLERVVAGQVSESFFRAFRAPIALGRPFSAAEDSPGAPRTVVLSHAFWTRRLAADPNVVGTALTLGGVPHTVIGVMAPALETEEFRDVAVWVPFQLDPASTDMTEYLQVAARLKPGVSLELARQRLAASTPAFRERAPGLIGPGATFSAIRFEQGGLGSQTRAALWALSGTVVLVLLIACASVANLLIARGLGRRREIAIRAALGAGSGRILRRLLTESALLSIAGAALGLLLGFAGIRALLAVDTAGLPRIGAGGAALGIDWRIVAFTAALSIATTVVFGLGPGALAARTDPAALLKSGSGEPRHVRLRSLLVVGQIGLAVVLLIGAALLIRTSLALARVDPGFAVDDVLVMRTSLAEPRFATAAAVQELTTNVLGRLRALPGVAEATASCCVPLQMSFGDVFDVVGRDNGNQPVTGGGDIAIATSSYFATLKVPLLRGRVFDERDGAGAEPVVVVNRTLAERWWPNGQDPLQSRMQIGRNPAVRQVVGIVDDVRALRLSSKPRPIMYLPLAQIPDADLALQLGNEPLAWIVRTQVDPAVIAASIQNEVRTVTQVPVTDVQPMRSILSASIARQRLNMLLMTLFGAAALLLASVGIYGLVAFSVEQRTHEIGIRLALGARAGRIRGLVLKQGLGLAAVGTAFGVAAAFLLAHVLASNLYGVAPHDALVFASVPALLVLVVAAAVMIPAHRASRVDPLVALRHD
ncbi:MAG TPA: ABC transporter permease [Gammaproteobacteria bacterium]|nr:ABC transporter permease [Gammaproteobacteria bacterium]